MQYVRLDFVRFAAIADAPGARVTYSNVGAGRILPIGSALPHHIGRAASSHRIRRGPSRSWGYLWANGGEKHGHEAGRHEVCLFSWYSWMLS
jgi:hypothetical protein